MKEIPLQVAESRSQYKKRDDRLLHSRQSDKTAARERDQKGEDTTSSPVQRVT